MVDFSVVLWCCGRPSWCKWCQSRDGSLSESDRQVTSREIEASRHVIEESALEKLVAFCLGALLLKGQNHLYDSRRYEKTACQADGCFQNCLSAVQRSKRQTEPPMCPSTSSTAQSVRQMLVILPMQWCSLVFWPERAMLDRIMMAKCLHVIITGVIKRVGSDSLSA